MSSVILYDRWPDAELLVTSPRHTVCHKDLFMLSVPPKLFTAYVYFQSCGLWSVIDVVPAVYDLLNASYQVLWYSYSVLWYGPPTPTQVLWYSYSVLWYGPICPFVHITIRCGPMLSMTVTNLQWCRADRNTLSCNRAIISSCAIWVLILSVADQSPIAVGARIAAGICAYGSTGPD
jgi:hypothetical protein